MQTLLFRDINEAQKHIKRLHRAFLHYEVYRSSSDGSAAPFSLQQVYSLVARISGFERWEDLAVALVRRHVTRYLDYQANGTACIRAERDAAVARIAAKAAKEVDAQVPFRHIEVAFHAVGFACSPKAHEWAMSFIRPALKSGLTAVQLSTVMWVDESFSRATRYRAAANYEALDFLRRKVLAEYLGRPLPRRPRGVKVTEDDRSYEKMLRRYLRIAN